MGRNLKLKIIILITLTILFAILPLITKAFIFTGKASNNVSVYTQRIYLDNDNLKISKNSEKIHIDGNSDWAAFKADGNCTGNGTSSKPYIIKDLIIDAGESGSAIWIENSDVYFIIENCTVYNSGGPMGAGIRLDNTNNSQLINNNCSSNLIGISLRYSYNNTISGNTIDSGAFLDFSDNSGIFLYLSNNNSIVNNSLYRGRFGIYLHICEDITISENKMKDCGLNLYLSSESIIADTTNLVNGKPVYYYNNKTNLGSDNFTNAGQVILYNCHESSIENLNISYGSTGISLDNCNNNTITGNIANHNKMNGIYLSKSDYNNVSGNTFNYNVWEGIALYRSYYNVISKNNASYNYQGVDSWICGRNNISGNILNSNRLSGVYLYDSPNSLISDNIINANERYGVFIYESNSNVLLNNTVNGSSLAGIYLLSSDYNNISANTLIRNCKCIKEEDCQGNIFINNTCVEICVEIFPLELIIIISIVSGIIVIGVAAVIIIRHIRKK